MPKSMVTSNNHIFFTFNLSLLDCIHFWTSLIFSFNFSSRVTWSSAAENVRDLSSAYISTDDDSLLTPDVSSYIAVNLETFRS